ncbi:MAG: LiaI-LiaF-like domain-containing protein [Acidithiobacillales bacterium]
MSDVSPNLNQASPNPPPAWPAPPAVPPPAQPAPPVAYLPAPIAVTTKRKDPAAAGLLSFFPGLGHIYLGLYQRGFAFFAVFVVTIAIANRTNTGPLFPMFWWFFVLIDAVRQAKAINLTGAPESNLLPSEKPMNFSASLTFGIFLVLVGAFFLLERYVRIDLSFLWDLWPVLLIAFGAWQIFLFWKSRQSKEPKEPKLGA